MKICLIGPGELNIPPNGWGALETVIWNQYLNLKLHGNEVKIVNETDIDKTYREIASFNPDIVHLHCGKHWEILPLLNCKKIVTNHDGGFLYHIQNHENTIRQFMSDCIFYVLTTWEYSLLKKIGICPLDIFIIPNGVDYHSIKKLEKPMYDKTICLGKIDERKNQSFLQQLNADIIFVGANHDPNFNPLDANYIGQWTQEMVKNNLTEYTNLILLSHSELQPLVCLEAMSAGLGLVISEMSTQNLDLGKEFISVIPQEKMMDVDYITKTILNNKKICGAIDRNEITTYAHTFDWSNIIQHYIKYL